MQKLQHAQGDWNKEQVQTALIYLNWFLAVY